MRLLSLDLERYGPFSGRSLRFRPDARLHVVLGPNEAGKSSALAAVTDLLFGIETRTRHAFLHPMPEMRVGAEIAAGDGRRLAFRRRKGNRNTLVDSRDGPLPDDALAPFLGGLTRQVFCHAFGLDAETLRKGGEEMMNSEGEVGASLAAAASGLRGYAALQTSLEEEAEKIFMPRAAQSRSFYQALARYDEARKAARAGELRAGDWRALNDAIAAAGARLDGLKAQGEARAAERARLERLKRVGPLIAEIDALAARAEADEGLAALPAAVTDAWTDGLGERIAAAGLSAQARERAAAALAQAAGEAEGVVVDEALRSHADKVAEAFAGIARFEKDGLDLPRIQAEAERFARDLAALAARVGLAPDLLRDRLPSDPARTRIAGLIATGRDLSASLTRLGRERDRHAAEQARWAPGGPAEAPAADPAPLRADLKALGPLRAEIARLDALDAAILRGAGPLVSAAGRLCPPVADLAALARLPLPSGEAVARFRREAEDAERACVRTRDVAAQAERAAAETRERLRAIEGGRPIPTPADLAALRAGRDRLLDGLRPALASAEPAPAGALAGFERALAAADRAADALTQDAARVAEHADGLRRLHLQEGELKAALAGRAEADAARGIAEAAWTAAWKPAGLVPAPPAEMAAWRAEAETLIEAHQAVETERLERARLAARIEGHRAALRDLGRRAGLPELDGLPLGLVLDRLETRVAALAEAWEAARESKAGARAAAGQAARIEAEIGEARAAQAAWSAQWSAAIGLAGLTADATPDEAASALAAWNEVPGVLEALLAARRRVEGMRRDRAAYAGDVAGLVGDLAPDLAPLPPGAAMKALHGRLRVAQTEAARRDELLRRKSLAERAHAAERDAADTAARALAEHLAVAGRSDAAEAADLHARLLARRALRGELAARRDALARVADGVGEAVLRAERAALSADAIEAALHRLHGEREEAQQHSNVAFAERDRCERQRRDLEAGMGAELASAQRKAAEAEIQAAAREWAVLKVASLMLGSAIGRHRAGQQDPLVARAGALFSGLTGGAFAGLVQYYNEDDLPCIGGNRGSGKPVPVEGLSEGTRDQLYLALRLAYLEDYAARSEPAPFIGDDLFLTFDDARTGHGIEALASLGGAIQPILFTHHRHVAEIARARLGEGVEVLAL